MNIIVKLNVDVFYFSTQVWCGNMVCHIMNIKLGGFNESLYVLD